MMKRRASQPEPPAEFGDLAEAFANPTGATAGQRQAAAGATGNPAELPEPDAETPRRGRGRPRSEVDLVNQTLSIRADQLRQLHRISAAEYARLGRRVLPSEVVRALLDRALSQPGSQEGLLG